MSFSSNVDKGDKLTRLVKRLLENLWGIELLHEYAIPVGFNEDKRLHRFDLGCAEPKIIVECKHHVLTVSGNVPSAKIATWNEAMLYFVAAGAAYQKHFVLPKSGLEKETLGTLYMRRYGHLVPADVTIWEFDFQTSAARVLERTTKKPPNVAAALMEQHDAGEAVPKSRKIRELHASGHEYAEIARLLNVRYQFVHNVLGNKR